MRIVGVLVTIPFILFPVACGSPPETSTSTGASTTSSTGSGTGGATSSTSSGAGGASSSTGSDTGGATSATSSASGTSSGTGGAAPCDPAQTSADPHNCGACGHDCLGGACKNSLCKPFAIVTGPAEDLAIDAKNVFWRNGDDKTVYSTPLQGGAATTLIGGIGYIISLYVIGTELYVGSQDSLYVLPIGGVGSTLLAGGLNTPIGVQLVAGSLYFTNLTGSTVMKMSLPGGVPKIIAGGQLTPAHTAVDAKNLYWVNVGSPLQSNGSVMSIPLQGGPATVLVAGEESPCGLVSDGVNLYWSNIGGTSLKMVPLAGGAPTTLVAGTTVQFEGCSVAVDAGFVYWTTSRTGQVGTSTGQIHRMPLGGGAPATILSNLPYPVGVLVDDVSIFWLNDSPVVGKPHQIMRLAK